MKKFALLFIVVLSNQVIAVQNFVLISAPGSGKGTFSQYLVKNHGYAHICPGDIFRKEICEQTELGKKIQPIVDNGDYVDKKILFSLVSKHFLEIIQKNKPFIVDGFPRAKISFDFLHRFFQKHNLVKNVSFVQLIADDKVCIQRILNRLICPNCSTVFSRMHQDKCNDCKCSLIPRKADTEEIAKKRLKHFHSEVEPILGLAKKSYPYVTVKTQNVSSCDLKKKYEELIK